MHLAPCSGRSSKKSEVRGERGHWDPVPAPGRAKRESGWDGPCRPTRPFSVHERELLRERVALDLASEVRRRNVGPAEVNSRPDACLNHLIDHVREVCEVQVLAREATTG